MVRKMIDRVLLGGMAGLFAIGAHPATAKVVKAEGDLFVTRDSAEVKTAPLATWLMLIRPGEWWNSAHTWSGDAANMTLTPQGGGCFCERIPEQATDKSAGLAGSAQHMTVVMAQPLKVLRMRGGLGPLQSEPAEGVLTITLQPTDAGGTKIVWEYVVGGPMRYPIDKIAEAVDGVMSEQLSGLADKLGRADAPAAEAKEAAEPAATTAAGPTDVGSALDAMAAKKASEKDGDMSGDSPNR